ncbi:hypothetical protein CYMTET_16154 [Cymbomonas tetramitiformis]|uniref:Uncharacterized protein n=1 Tax=Cymbomonas tetramitiformis TaxID=36881 RepID=A0AAE0L882_9CHLO|nr:hypothetical protein CYMTET_16154 [Cymbomonas tetramitiformis]
MNTEKGRLCYTMNLQQIRNAVLETVYLGVLEALLNCKTVDEMWNERYGGNIRTATLARKALMMEVEDWATIQKTPHGWDLLDSRCKRYLRAKGVQPDTWIVPEGMKPYVTQVRRENYVYALAGPDGPKNFDSARNGQSEHTTLDARNDCKIFEAKAFELPDLTEPVDVTRRVRSIGEFFLMQPEQTYGQATQYDSSHRNIAIFDEDVDAFVEITLRDALLNDAFFNEETRKPAWSRKKLPYMRVSPDTPFDQWTSRAHADDDDAGDGALLGDLPETDDADNNVNNSHPHAVPLSSTTTIRFASSFFTADDQTCFSRCFGREIPSVLRAMDVAKNMTTPPMNSTETSIFQKILNAMQSYILYPDTTKYISEIQSFYAHSDNAYSLWMFAHSITWEATHHRDGEASIAGENDCGYSSALMNSYSALHRGQHIPDPPRWCDRSITILTRAIMYALLHTRPLLKQILKHAEDICDKSGAIIPTGESSKRQRIPYAAISCTSSSFDTVSAAVATWCVEGAGSYVSANLKALLEVATFSALNVHATLSGPSASSTTLCDGMSIILRSPIGYDSYRGVRRLAESGESIYEPEACANLVRNYDTLHQIAQPLFSTSALHQIKDSFFGPCVLNHKSTGNIHIDIGAVDEKTMDNAIALYKIAPDDLLHQLVELRPDECQVEFHGRTSSTWSWTNHNSAQYADEIRKRCPAFTMIHEMMAQIDTVAGSNVYSTGKPFEEYVKGLGELWMRMQRMWASFMQSHRRRGTPNFVARGESEASEAPCSETIADRVQNAEKRLVARPHELAIFVMFVTMDFSRRTLELIIDCNKMFPFGYLLMRPYQTYQMCAAILTKSGKETGETLIGHYDFQLSDDVVRKMHYGNFTIYQKAVVYNPKNVMPVADIWCQAYLGGGGSIFARHANDAGTGANANTFGASVPSLYACIIGLDEVVKGIKRVTTPPPEIWIESV